jgi:hypothetical protein
MADKSTSQKRTVNRSTAYPGITLEKAIEATKLLRENLGMTPFSRDSAATALGYKAVSGASVQKVSACVHFGLLTRKGNTYSQSELADQMFRYISEEEREAAIKSAAQKPVLYARLIDEFNGRALPKMLDNILVRSYGITERVAKDVANVFEKSVQYAGLLQNGVITADEAADIRSHTADETYAATDIERGQAPPSPADGTAPPSSNSVSPPPASSDYLTIEIPDTDVKILFPMSYAYDLSVGSFKTGIEALSNSIKGVQPVKQNDDQAPTT